MIGNVINKVSTHNTDHNLLLICIVDKTSINIIITLYEHIVIDYYCCIHSRDLTVDILTKYQYNNTKASYFKTY